MNVIRRRLNYEPKNSDMFVADDYNVFSEYVIMLLKKEKKKATE